MKSFFIQQGQNSATGNPFIKVDYTSDFNKEVQEKKLCTAILLYTLGKKKKKKKKDLALDYYSRN